MTGMSLCIVAMLFMGMRTGAVLTVIMLTVIMVMVINVLMSIVLVAVISMSVLMHAMAMIVIAGFVALLLHHLIAFEQANTEKKRQAHLTFDRAQDAGIMLEGT